MGNMHGFRNVYILFSVLKTTARIDSDWLRTWYQNLKEACLDKGCSVGCKKMEKCNALDNIAYLMIIPIPRLFTGFS